MTREEALAYALSQKAGLESELHRTPCGYGNWAVYSTVLDFINAALSALRPVSREQVEKVWKGEWKCQSDCGVTECTACKWNIEEYCGDYNFCPHCGAPMNDEAIHMVMERMKELK